MISMALPKRNQSDGSHYEYGSSWNQQGVMDGVGVKKEARGAISSSLATTKAGLTMLLFSCKDPSSLIFLIQPFP